MKEMNLVGLNNIDKTMKYNLCISCRLCYAICQNNAITFEKDKGRYLPKINNDKCIQCGICLKVCPGIEIDINSFHIYDKKINENITSYIVASKNQTNRFTSTSGGFISTFISILLEKKIYSDVFTCNSNCNEYSQIELTNSKKQKMRHIGSGSMYLPISALKIAEHAKKGVLNSIIVCTPCILLGLKKYLNIKKINYESSLFIGLFCDCTLNYNFINFLRNKYGNGDEEIKNVLFRCKEKIGWPGSMKVIFDSGRKISIFSNVRVMLKKYFKLFRCLSCYDKFNSLSDIACGDCYLPDEKSFLGLSNIIVWTEKGRSAFEQTKDMFSIKDVSLDNIFRSQNYKGLLKKIDNAKEMKDLINNDKNYLIFKGEMKKEQKMIKLGEKGDFKKINVYYTFEQIKIIFKKIFKKVRKIITKINLNFLSIYNLFAILIKCIHVNDNKVFKGKINKTEKTDAIIWGGNFVNKGAQAMCYHLVNELKKSKRFKKVYLFSSVDYMNIKEHVDKYTFEIVRWDNEMAKCFSGIKKSIDPNINKNLEQIKEIFISARAIFDISGFGLSSKHGINGTIKYILNLYNAKRYDIPLYILPQSIGPFNYRVWHKPFVKYLLKKLFNHPKIVFAREQKTFEHMKSFCCNELIYCPDMVLFLPEIQLDNIFLTKVELRNYVEYTRDTICIIPNERVADRILWSKLSSYYKTIINIFKKKGYKTVILRHSKEDLIICEKIKNMFIDDDSVGLITDDLNKFELEKVIKNCEFVVTSRYHGLVHAYRNNVPAFVLGWADKYEELMNIFNQNRYHFSLYDGMNLDMVKEAINVFINEKQKNKEIIAKSLIQVEKNGMSLKILFELFANEIKDNIIN